MVGWVFDTYEELYRTTEDKIFKIRFDEGKIL